MKRGMRRSAVLIFGLLVLMSFNNCGVYESGLTDANSFQMASLNCQSETDCVTRSNLNLKITPLPNSTFYVAPSLQAFNIGGDCNEAGYPNHQIVWRLKLNNAVVRHSGMQIHGQTWNSVCVNGKFRVYVNLAPIGEDPVDRTGLMYGSGTNKASYDLEFEILAQDSDGNWVRNASQGGVKSLTLAPLAGS